MTAQYTLDCIFHDYAIDLKSSRSKIHQILDQFWNSGYFCLWSLLTHQSNFIDPRTWWKISKYLFPLFYKEFHLSWISFRLTNIGVIQLTSKKWNKIHKVAGIVWQTPSIRHIASWTYESSYFYKEINLLIIDLRL